ncbi:MAG: winged helix-turn-helix transcriptional regulator [Betaproteobacteria bacterium]|nr:winged helix-turn-helix transcriptional regulator [Betaproteobacteria bacterium]
MTSAKSTDVQPTGDPLEPVSCGPLPCTGGRLRKLTRRMTSFYEQHLRAIGLKLSQYSVLMNLSTEPQTLLQLADRLEMDRTTLTRSLKPLVDQGWVAEVAGDDARRRLLVLTASGHRFRKQAQQVWCDAQLALETQLGRDFTADLNAQLDRALSQLKPALPEEN